MSPSWCSHAGARVYDQAFDVCVHVGCSIMLFSHLVLFLEYTVVHYSARQKYREQVITDAQLRKLMAYDEVATEILGDPQLAVACGLVDHSSIIRQGSNQSSAAVGDVDGPGSAPPATAVSSLTAQELEQALKSMAPEAKRIVDYKLRVARARLGGSVSEWGEAPEDFYPTRAVRRRWGKGSRAVPDSAGKQSSDSTASFRFGIGARETILAAAPLPLGDESDDALDENGDREELENGSSGVSVTPGRELPGTPDKSLKARRRLREKDRGTTDRAIVGSLSEPLFSGGSATDSLDAGPPRLAGQGGSSPVEELELGRPDDDRVVREKEWCGPRVRAKSRHVCNGCLDWCGVACVLAGCFGWEALCTLCTLT
jgi:hypothetical protein